MAPPIRGARGPLGQIVWTSKTEADAVLRFQNYFPGTKTPLGETRKGELELRVGHRSFPVSTTKGADGASFPFCLMHACFDWTGTELFFASGRSLWVESGKVLPPVTDLWKAHPDKARRLLTRTAKEGNKESPGTRWDALMHPATDPDGRWIYYTRQRYGNDPLLNGFFLERCDPTGKPDSAFNSARIRGSQPALSSTGRFLAFVRCDVYREDLDGDPWPSDHVPPLGGGYDNSTDLWVLDVRALEADGPAAGPFKAEYGKHLCLLFDASANRRVLKPCWDPFGKGLAFAHNGSREIAERFHTTFLPYRIWWVPFDGSAFESNWDDGRSRLTRRGDLVALTESEGRDDPSQDAWPSFSADGRYLAFTREGRSGADPSRVCYVEIPETPVPGGPCGEAQLVQEAEESIEQLWPVWNQDEDPPNLQIRIIPTDSDQVTHIRLIDENPDLDPDRDSATLHVSGPHFDPSARSTARTTWTFVYPTADRHDLALTLSTDAGLPAGFRDHARLSDLEGRSEALPDAMKGMQALWLRQNVRVKIQVLAKDDRWRRVLLSPSEEDGRATGTPLTIETSRERRADFFDPLCPEARYETANAANERNTDPPYLPRRSPEALDEAATPAPGLSWWIEPLDPASGSASVERLGYSANAETFIFRTATHPREQHPTAPRWYALRVVAQDRYLNRTDLIIPIAVVEAGFKIQGLGFDSQRQAPKAGTQSPKGGAWYDGH